MSFLIDSSIMITSQVSRRPPSRARENLDLLSLLPSPGSEGSVALSLTKPESPDSGEGLAGPSAEPVPCGDSSHSAPRLPGSSADHGARRNLAPGGRPTAACQPGLSAGTYGIGFAGSGADVFASARSKSELSFVQ